MTTVPPPPDRVSLRAHLEVLAVLLRSISRLVTGAPRLLFFLCRRRAEQRRTAQIVLSRDDVEGLVRPGDHARHAGPAR